jgi:hypothetical protein
MRIPNHYDIEFKPGSKTKAGWVNIEHSSRIFRSPPGFFILPLSMTRESSGEQHIRRYKVEDSQLSEMEKPSTPKFRGRSG